jgi:hypothetical protein
VTLLLSRRQVKLQFNDERVDHEPRDAGENQAITVLQIEKENRVVISTIFYFFQGRECFVAFA